MKINLEVQDVLSIPLMKIYDFLKSEGLTLKESKQLISKMEEIYDDVMKSNQSYSVSEISVIVSELLDDTFFDERFIIALLEEAEHSNVEWANLSKEINYFERNISFA